MLPEIDTLGALAVYGLLTAVVFAESGLLVGFFLPGDTVLFAAGLYSADPSSGVSLPLLAALVLLAAVVGDGVGYWFGQRVGAPVLRRRDGRVLNARNLSRAQDFYDRYGLFAVVAARWVPWVRTFTPILAGAAGMPYGRFLAANVAGALSWGVGLLVLGRLAASVPGLKQAAVGVAAAVVALSVVAAAVHVYRERSAARR